MSIFVFLQFSDTHLLGFRHIRLPKLLVVHVARNIGDARCADPVEYPVVGFQLPSYSAPDAEKPYNLVSAVEHFGEHVGSRCLRLHARG